MLDWKLGDLHPTQSRPVDEDESKQMMLRVVCYSGRKEDERPLRFQLDGHEYLVEEVVDQWYGPDDAFFKVLASDGNLYVLRHRSSTPEVEWSLESFMDLSRGGTRGFPGTGCQSK